MKILILGGTRFLGRHLVDAAIARGHEVTIFNRGNYPSHRNEVEFIGEIERMTYTSSKVAVGMESSTRVAICRAQFRPPQLH